MSDWQPIETAPGDTCLVRAGGATIIATRVGTKRPLWSVTHGPDDSHLIETEVFDTRGDALARFAELRDRRPCKVWRLAWRSPYVAEDCDRREIASSPLRKESPADGP